MFWKKKKQFTSLFTHASSDKRDAYRLAFGRDEAPEILFKGKKVSLINLSAGGTAFKNAGFSVGDRDTVTVALRMFPDVPPVSLALEIEIMEIDTENICRCLFRNRSEDSTETIHKFLLEKQKQTLKKT